MNNKEDRRFQYLAHVIMILASILCIVPFILLITSSITDETTILRNGYSFFPEVLSLDAYKYLFTNTATIFRAYGITIFVTAVGTVAGLTISVLTAYPLSRRDLPKGRLLMFLVVFTMLFNGGLVPTYLVYTQLFHIKNTIFALIVPMLLMNGFNVMLLRNYFVTNIPPALLESANIDGAGEMTTFIKIVLPLSLPITATIGLMQGIMYWNDWNNGLIYITNPKLFSLQNLLNRIIMDAQSLQSLDLGGDMAKDITQIPNTAIRMAIAVVAVIPIMALYPFFQKYFVKGITIGSVKG